MTILEHEARDMIMNRRSSAVSGEVRFPVDDPNWMNSEEGGMVVKLVVCDNRDFDNQFGICCGASVTDILSDSLIGDSLRPKPISAENYDSIESLMAEQDARSAWEAYHFPRIADESVDGVERYLSRDYLASMVLGTTGWSGWNEAEGRYWECRFDDLTNAGMALYRQVEALYPGCELHLLTFLDT